MALLPTRPARSDAGFALIEVVVSAAVLAIISLAILAGIDGATGSTGREKARSVAAVLAEQDQERLRAMPVEQLATYAPAPAPINVDGASYTVGSKVEWVHDSTGGTVSCANDTTQADYLHITSTVTSPIVGTNVAPVEIDSIVAPNVEYSTTHGSLAVKVVDSAGAPMSGVLVTVTGASSPLPQATNVEGCALFQGIDVGSYVATLNAGTLVDPEGHSPPSKTTAVTPSSLTVLQIDTAVSGTVNATIESYKPGTNQVIPSAASRISAMYDVNVLRNAPDAGPGPALALQPMTKLYPFSGAYSFFTGTCRYSNPAEIGLPAYYTTYPGAIQVPEGGSVSVKIRQAALNIRLSKDLGGGTATNAMKVVATPVMPTGQSCVEPSIVLQTFTTILPGPTTVTGVVGRSQPNSAYVEAGVPFGDYTICFERGTNAATWKHTDYPADYGTAIPYDNALALGQPAQLALDASNNGKWHSGQCSVTP
jgi:prepilin-type N-terminal cleavage/methylation domain-containing protein